MKSQKTEKLLHSHTPIDPEEFELLSDEQIIAKVKTGSVRLFEVIVRRYNQQLFRIVRSYLSDEEDVKDVMQTAYLKAYKKLHQFRGEAQFSTWLIRIAINEALKLLKKKKQFSELESVTKTVTGDQTNGSGASTPETKAIQNDMKDYLEKAIDRLPSDYRKVFVMRHIEHMSTRETAECLNISRVNVKVRLHRAKNMLRDELTKMLGEIDLFSFKGKNCDRMTEQVMSLIKSNNRNNDPVAP